MIPSNCRVCEVFFEADIVDKSYHTCLCGKSFRQKVGSGYHNLMSHMTRDHPRFEEVVSCDPGTQFSLTDFLLRPSDMDKWINWIISENLPLSFCESEATAKYAKLKPVTAKTLKKKMFSTMALVEAKIRDQLL